MIVQVPCRLGEKFRCDKLYSVGVFYLTGLDVFVWKGQAMPGVTLCGKKDPTSKQERTTFFWPGDPVGGCGISFELPDAIFIPGFPLRKLGIAGDAVGYLQGLGLKETALGIDWEFHVYFGKEYGGPRKSLRTDRLDELFAPVLPLHAVQVNAMDYLL